MSINIHFLKIHTTLQDKGHKSNRTWKVDVYKVHLQCPLSFELFKKYNNNVAKYLEDFSGVTVWNKDNKI